MHFITFLSANKLVLLKVKFCAFRASENEMKTYYHIVFSFVLLCLFWRLKAVSRKEIFKNTFFREPVLNHLNKSRKNKENNTVKLLVFFSCSLVLKALKFAFSKASMIADTIIKAQDATATENGMPVAQSWFKS